METVDLLAGRDVLFVRGNADRSVTELAERLQDPGAEATPRERWMVEQHDAPMRALLAGVYPASVELEVDGLGDVLLCTGWRGSSRSLSRSRPRGAARRRGRGHDAAGAIATAHTHVGSERQLARPDVLRPRQRRHAL